MTGGRCKCPNGIKVGAMNGPGPGNCISDGKVLLFCPTKRGLYHFKGTGPNWSGHQADKALLH